MGFLSREALLGASDLTTREVELATIGGTVQIRSLPAAYSNEATSQALEMITDRRGGQTARVNTVKLEALQVLHALVDPKLNSIEDAYTFSQQCGPAWRTLVDAIDDISGIDKASIERTNATFQAGGHGEGGASDSNGVGAGSGGPDLHV